jgi:hypothetical protein
MNNEKNIPEWLLEHVDLNPQPRRATRDEIIREAIIEALVDLPDSAFTWNWRKWRYECVIDGHKTWVTFSEYFGSRRLRRVSH